MMVDQGTQFDEIAKSLARDGTRSRVNRETEAVTNLDCKLRTCFLLQFIVELAPFDFDVSNFPKDACANVSSKGVRQQIQKHRQS